MAKFLVSILIAILTSSLHTAERVSDEDWLQDANTSTDAYTLVSPHSEGNASDCPNVGCSTRTNGGSEGLAECKAACDGNASCNLINFVPDAAAAPGYQIRGRCCMRACQSLDHLNLTGKWKGWDVYTKKREAETDSSVSSSGSSGSGSNESTPAGTHEDSVSFSAMKAKGKELQELKKRLQTEVVTLDEKEREYKKANEAYGYSSAALAESLNSFAESVEGFRETVSDANRKTVDETREVMKAPMEGGLGGGSEEPSQEHAGVEKEKEQEETKT